jgi:hypothetical protein
MLVTANSNGHVLGWNINDNSTDPIFDFLAHNDCTNGLRCVKNKTLILSMNFI